MMTPDQAFKILSDVTGLVPMVREDHRKVDEALEMIAKLIEDSAKD